MVESESNVYPINSRRRLLRLTPLVDLARINRKICGNFSTIHTNSVVKLAMCSNSCDSIVHGRRRTEPDT